MNILTAQEPPEASHESIEEHLVQDISSAVHTFNDLDWVTRVLLVVALCWLGWVYRRQLGRLIPHWGNPAPKPAGTAKKKAKKKGQ